MAGPYHESMAPPKMPRPLAAASNDVGAGRFPRPLLVGVGCWVLLGLTLLMSRVGAPSPTDANATSDALNTDVVRAPTPDTYWFVPFLPWLGVVVLVMAVVLFLGYGWARLALAVLGMLAVVGLAQAALWLVIPAGVLFLVGSVCGLVISSHRYLTATRSTTSDAGSGRRFS